MAKRLFFWCGLLAVILIASPALVQAQIQPQHSDPVWQASYWNNTSLSGPPVLQREETNLNYDWGAGSPNPAVNPDNFSARWTRYFELDAGTYRFTTTSDDGIKVLLDGTPIISDWTDHAEKVITVDKSVSAGHHLIQVEFYEHLGDAVLKFSFETGAITEWRGEYYNNMGLSGSPVLVRNDAAINFGWGTGSPAPGVVNPDEFSVRWTRTLHLDSGSYRFTVTVDDGVRLWVNGHLLIDQWKDQVATYSGVIYVSGDVPVKMEYYEHFGAATAKLSWALEGSQPGTVIVDDKDAGFVKGGSTSSWRIVYEGYNGRLYWTKNNDKVRDNYNWARWYPHLAAGRYEVFVYIPEQYTTTAQARYWVSHADGYTLKIVNQSTNGNKWVSLGTYRFRGTSSDYVSLSDVTYEPYLSRLIAFDAVKWVPQP